MVGSFGAGSDGPLHIGESDPVDGILLEIEFHLLEDAQDGGLQEAMRKAEVAKYCCIVVSTVPAIVLYIFMQKYFVKGVMIGSLKG